MTAMTERQATLYRQLLLEISASTGHYQGVLPDDREAPPGGCHCAGCVPLRMQALALSFRHAGTLVAPTPSC